MGKRGGGKRRVFEGATLFSSLSLRDQASGKKKSHNLKAILKLKHLQRLAEWSSGVASIPSLGAFFGRRFADFGEALGIPPNRSLFPCQRCETILQPDFNCNVRTEKDWAEKRRPKQLHKKTDRLSQDIVVYTCNFCSHRNMKAGTPKGYVREKDPLKANSCLKPEVADFTQQEYNDTGKSNTNKLVTPSVAINNVSASLIDNPTPSVTTGAFLLDDKRRKRKKPGSKEPINELAPAQGSSASVEASKASGISRKKRKSWTSLKEIAANEEHERNQRFKNISIPFVL